MGARFSEKCYFLVFNFVGIPESTRLVMPGKIIEHQRRDPKIQA